MVKYIDWGDLLFAHALHQYNMNFFRRQAKVTKRPDIKQILTKIDEKEEKSHGLPRLGFYVV